MDVVVAIEVPPPQSAFLAHAYCLLPLITLECHKYFIYAGQRIPECRPHPPMQNLLDRVNLHKLTPSASTRLALPWESGAIFPATEPMAQT